MPKIYAESQKQRWFELYESGKSINYIAKKYAGCDPRTVQAAIEDTGRKQYARIATIQIIKEKILLHQRNLLDEIENIITSLSPPPFDHIPLSWYGSGANSVFTKPEEINYSFYAVGGLEKNGRNIAQELVRNHLKNESAWNMYIQWRKEFDSHLTDRVNLQLKVVDRIKQKTGYPLSDNPITQPSVCSYTTGELFLMMALKQAFEVKYDKKWQNVVKVNISAGQVRYQSWILAKAPGNEEICRTNLLVAFNDILQFPELRMVVKTYHAIEAMAHEIKPLFEEIMILDFVPGYCRICKRLGI